MDTIKELFAYYGLKRDECNQDWLDIVDEFEQVKSALPEPIRVQKEKEIVDSFTDYHEIENEQSVDPVIEKPVKKSKKKSKPVKKGIIEDRHEYDKKKLFDKADELLDLI